jgi:hypothetical protein
MIVDPRALVLAGALVGALGCPPQDRWDFDCKGTWGRGDKQMSEKTYRYPQLSSEQEAVRRCSEDMMKDRPAGAKSAKCECQGQG